MNWECCDLIGAKITDTFAGVEEGFKITEFGLRIADSKIEYIVAKEVCCH